MKPLDYCVVLAAALGAGSAGAGIVSGPMAGLAAMREASIWFQADQPGLARVEFWPHAQPRNKKRSAAVRLTAEQQFTARIALVGLEPGTAYDYRVLLRGQGPSPVYAVRSQALWQWRGNPPDFSVAFGSCAYYNDAAYDRPGKPYGSGYDILNAMAATKPDLVLWLGDNLYFREADNSPWAMADRYQRTRRLPEMQALLRTGQHIAIWDDHDYGPNDANRSFIYKEEALRLFRRYWPNPSYGLPQTPGTFTVASFGDADFFLLDDRWYRDADGQPETAQKQMFGPEQMNWLQNALAHSSATFKFIVGGSQMLNELNAYEGWNHFPAERGAFLTWLAQSGTRGVILLSGDRHHTELLQQPRPGSYPLLELTCSPLTAGVSVVDQEKQNPHLVAGTYVAAHNFCRLQFQGPKGQRSVTLSAHDQQGKLLWQRPVAESELQAPAAKSNP